MKFATTLFSLLILLVIPVLAQDGEPTPPPKHEFRSAWVATVPGLDWPAAGQSPQQQQTALRNIIRNMKAMGMNAVVFQVVPRGDAYYQSERLPWAALLTGTMGQDPGWDPLQFAIEEAHALGMELHAWYNFGRAGTLGPFLSETDEPKHLYYTNPEWLVQISNDLWLNPGVPEAREWAIGNVMEIVRNYDVDAVHFDFVRYAATSYPGDTELRDEHDPGMNLSTWRRENVSRWAMAVHDSVKAVKPWVKVGSTPFGHYQQTGGWAAALSYYQYYQDSRRWLREEKHDYLAPQIYWDIGSNCAPRFDWLVHDWVDESYDRHIYAGTGPYQCGGLAELPQQIDSTRTIGAHGQLHFRYGTIAGGPFADRYDHPAFVPPMDWLNMTEPPAPEALTHRWTDEDTTIVEISWEAPDMSAVEGPFRFAVYRIASDDEPDFDEVVLDPVNLIAVTGETSIQDEPDSRTYFYYVTTVSSNWVESTGGGSISLEGRAVSVEREVPVAFRLEQNYPNPFNPSTTIEYAVEQQGPVSLRVFNVLGQEVAVLVDGTLPAGAHRVSFDARDLASGTYFYVLEAGGRTLTRAMMLLK